MLAHQQQPNSVTILQAGKKHKKEALLIPGLVEKLVLSEQFCIHVIIQLRPLLRLNELFADGALHAVAQVVSDSHTNARVP